MRIHSADIARRAGKQASWIDDKLRWIKQNKPELWTLSAAGADVFLDYLGLPEPLADILLDRRVDADELIEIMTKKLGGECKQQGL